MSGSWLPVRRLLAIALIAVLATSATIGLHSITEEWSFLVPAAMGALTAAGAFVVAQRFRLLPGETLAMALGLFVLVGALAVSVGVGEAPSVGSFGDFFDGLIRSWADLLSAVTPADLTPRLAVAPYALAWFGTIVGCALLRWSPLPTAPVLGPLATLGITVLLTEEERALSILVGASIAVGALLLGVFLGDRTTDDAAGETLESTTSTAPHAHTLRIIAVIAAVAVLAPLVGPRLPLAEARPRYDLRDEVVPPWDPLSLPSPLVQLKAQLAAEREDTVMFEVTSDDPVTRWPLATMSSYDGVVWTVADPEDAASDFRPVGTRLPAPDAQPTSDPTVTATVTVRDLTGPWLPVPGVARELDFEQQPPTVMENPETSTLAVPNGVTPGMTYSVTALTAPEGSDDQLRDASLEAVDDSIDLDALPPQIRNLAADVTEGIDFGWGQVAAIRDLFTGEGFYDKTTRVPPGHSYYRLAQFLTEPDEIIGYEEQYAAAGAVIARIAELPARVVVGFEIEPDRYVDGVAEVRASDTSAWIEVRVDDVGWVPVSVSPPRSREPQTENAVASEDQVATPNPPPPPQLPPDVDVFTENEELEEPVEEEEEDEDEETETSEGGIGTVGWILIGSSGALVLLLAAAGVIVALKVRRTNRRRRADDPAMQIAGAWFELTERYDEAGVPTESHATPLESVQTLTATAPSAAESRPQLVGLARSVDRAAYGQTPPDAETAATAWRYSDEAVDALFAGRSLPQKTLMRVDPRPLMRKDPLRDLHEGRNVPTAPSADVGAVPGARSRARTVTDDDEVTTDVDPAWIAALRAEGQDSRRDDASDDPAPSNATDGTDGSSGEDWFDRADPPTPSDTAAADDGFDAESTIGASSELLARIRAEISADQPPASDIGDAPSATDTSIGSAPSPAATDVDAGPTATPARDAPNPLPPPILAQPAPARPAPPATPPASPPTTAQAAAATPSTADADSSMTVRWEPRQRLTGAAPLPDAPLASTQQTHHVLDRTRVVIAIIVAITLVVVVWLFVRSDGESDPQPPIGSVPTEPTSPGEPAEGQQGGGG